MIPIFSKGDIVVGLSRSYSITGIGSMVQILGGARFRRDYEDDIESLFKACHYYKVYRKRSGAASSWWKRGNPTWTSNLDEEWRVRDSAMEECRWDSLGVSVEKMEYKLCCLINGKIRHTPCNWKVCDKHWNKFLKQLPAMLKKGWPKDECCPKCGRGFFVV